MRHPPRVLLLGGPVGVGKSTALEALGEVIGTRRCLDADALWEHDAALAADRPRAQAHAVAAVLGRLAEVPTGSEAFDVVLAWVFAREALYGPIRDALLGQGLCVAQLYLVAPWAVVEQRVRERCGVRGMSEEATHALVSYARERSALIDTLPFDRVDTAARTPREVAECVLGWARARDWRALDRAADPA